MQSRVDAGYESGTRAVACSLASRVSLSAFPGAAMTTFSPGANGFSSFCMPNLVCMNCQPQPLFNIASYIVRLSECLRLRSTRYPLSHLKL